MLIELCRRHASWILQCHRLRGFFTGIVFTPYTWVPRHCLRPHTRVPRLRLVQWALVQEVLLRLRQVVLLELLWDVCCRIPILASTSRLLRLRLLILHKPFIFFTQ